MSSSSLISDTVSENPLHDETAKDIRDKALDYLFKLCALGDGLIVHTIGDSNNQLAGSLHHVNVDLFSMPDCLWGVEYRTPRSSPISPEKIPQ